MRWMTNRMLRRGFAALALALIGCAAPAGRTPPAEEPRTPGFENRVWAVRESTAVSPGTLYVFLSEGTLLIASEHGTPMVGRWQRTADGLTMVEEGIPYEVDVVELSDEEFTIRSHNPGEPVVTTLVPAPVEAWPRPR